MQPNVKIATVIDITDISPHMRRIVFHSKDFSLWPAGLESAHVKIIIPKPGQTHPAIDPLNRKKYMRSYTVRHFDPIAQHLSIDFAINDHTGLVSGWASTVSLGAYAGFMGPGPVKHTDFYADWHLLVADFTGLPALAATLERLPETAQGYAVIQVPSEHDKQMIKSPVALDIDWVVNPNPHKPLLYERVDAYAWMAGEPAIFIATEASQMKQLRRLVKSRPGYQRQKLYASGYWQA